MKQLYCCVITPLLLVLATSEKAVIDISNGTALKSYLCSANETIPSMTELVINVSHVKFFHSVEESYCHVQNTSNINITASGSVGYVKVQCLNRTGFKFWNVSNLTMRGIVFENCENQIYNSASESKVLMSLLFDHCNNLTLDNVLANSSDDTAIDILGINLCGSSTISADNAVVPASLSAVIYYRDSRFTSKRTNNSITVSSSKFRSKNMESNNRNLSTCLNQMRIEEYALSICLLQHSFRVLAHIYPKNKKESIDQAISIAIGFFQTHASKVICQGYPYDNASCYKDEILPVFLYAAFFDYGGNKLEVSNTTFIADGTKGFLQIIRRTFPGFTSNSLVVMNKVSFCTGTNHLDHPLVITECEACRSAVTSSVNLIMTDITIFDCCGHKRYCEHSDLMKFEGVNVLFNGTNAFNCRGDGNAMRAAKGIVTLTGYYESKKIALESDSTLQLKEPLNATFHNQRGSRGSAIYASNSSINILSDKTFSLENLTSIKIALTFTNSTNTGANTQVYAPEFNFLHVDDSEPAIFKEWDDNHNQSAYTTVIDTIFKNISDYDKFTSLSNGLCLQIQGQQNWTCKYIDFSFNSTDAYVFEIKYVYPGGIAFSFTDYKDFPIDNKITPYIHIENSKVSICRDDLLTSRQLIDINVTTIGGFNNVSFMEMNIYAYCPAGFEIRNVSENCQQCVCKKVFKNNQYKCDVTSLRFTAPHGYWTGISEDQNKTARTIKVGINCPPHYCKTNMSSFSLNMTLNYSSCLGDRSGVLCSQCKENFSAVFGSDVCYSHCSNLYLLTLPVYALAGLLLVVVLFALRLTVATGTINGVIFYANILKLVMNVEFEESDEKFVRVMNIIISLLNLNLGFPLCLYDGMSTTTAIGFQFVFPVYLWSLVLGMVILSKYSSRVANLVSKSSVQVLATLFYLSFSSLLRTVIVVVSPTTIQLSNEENDDSVILVWYYGGLDYGSGVHGLYLTIAFLFVLFFLFPFAIFTTFSHCLLRFKLVNKLRPFIEAYGGPFKNKRRFWFGVRLWVTILLFLVDSVFQGSDTHTMLIVHFTIIAVFIVLQAGIRPFKKFWFAGFLDIIYMINLFFVYEFYLMMNKEKAFDEVLLGVGLVSLVISLVYHIWLVRHFVSFKGKTYEVINENEAENSDDSLFDAAKRREPVIIKHHGPRQTY